MKEISYIIINPIISIIALSYTEVPSIHLLLVKGKDFKMHYRHDQSS